MTIYAIIPVKNLQRSKTRLLKVLGPEECQFLTLAMLEDVLNAVKKSSLIERIAVISSDPKIQDFAENLGVIYISEKRQGLNRAIVNAIRWCIQNKGKSILILSADIPLVNSNDVDNIINLCSNGKCFAISPSQRGGTGALFQKPPNLIRPNFGPNSFRKHLLQALEKEIPVKIYRSKTMALDIDLPEDLEELLKIDAQTKSHQLLKQRGLKASLVSAFRECIARAIFFLI